MERSRLGVLGTGTPAQGEPATVGSSAEEPTRVLFAGDDADEALVVESALRGELGAVTVVRANGLASFGTAFETPPDVVVTTDRFDGGTGLRALEAAKARWARVPVVLLSSGGTAAAAVEAMKAGLDDYVVMSPDAPARLAVAVRSAIERGRARSLSDDTATRCRRIVETTHDLIWSVSRLGVITYVNAVSRLVYDREPDDMIGRKFTDFLTREQAEIDLAAFRDALEEGSTAVTFEHSVRRRDGSEVLLRSNATVLRQSNGKVVEVIGTSQDVTERRATETALRRNAAASAAVFAAALDAVVTLDADGRVVEFNPAAERMFGRARADVVGRDFAPLAVAPAFRDAHRRAFARRAAKPRDDGEGIRLESVAIRADGREFPVEVSVVVIAEADRRRFAAFMRDISDRRVAEVALRASEERFRQLAENIHEVFWITNPTKREMLYISPAYEEIWGRPVRELYDRPASWLESIAPGDRDRVLTAATAQQIEGTYDETYQILRPDGTTRWIRDRAFPVRDATGAVYRVVGIAEDVTKLVTTQAALRQSEEEVRRTQKMQAVGRLAGGIAHDFNNILTVIEGYGAMITANLALEDPMRAWSEAVLEAGRRAAALTRQLLAVSRNQPIEAKLVDLDAVVANLDRMLKRVIGEHISFETVLAAGGALVLVDPSQMEQVILNLVVNARDAMPEGGTLRIETFETDVGPASADGVASKLTPGRYVVLVVSDTGIGMSNETQEHIFEPFFTTKEVGKGTGLGLSTVYGIVTQSHGHVAVTSERGKGATFRIYLPRAEGTTAPDVVATSSVRPVRGSECVLLVEDEEAVRALVASTLRRAGFRVVAARDPADALKKVGEFGDRIDLVLTDVVMPGMSGPEMVARLAAAGRVPRAVYMSGNPDLVVSEQRLAGGTSFLQKPFAGDVLVRAVRDALDRP